MLLFPLLGLPACGSIGTVSDLTGAIAPPRAPAAAASAPAVAPSDWEAVRQSVARAPAAKPVESGRERPRIEWNNAETGNSGTISDVIASSRAGAPCKGFATTVSSVDGVRLYRGELCRAGRSWELVTVEPADRGRM